MIDYKTQIKTALDPILTTYYELYADGNITKPCITYVEYNNYDVAYSDARGYSVVQFMVSIWDTNISNIMTKALLVDSAMRTLGFHRVSSSELPLGKEIRKQMLYEANVYETY